MTLLLVGLAVWTAAHLFKAVALGARAGLTARLGARPARGAFAAAIGLGLVLIILGYRAAPFDAVWSPPAWTVHLNNLLMLIAVAVFGMSMSKGRTRAWLRHPMLTAVVIWAVAHLLVNGDLASIVMFGWLGIWALAEMALINMRDGAWVRPAPGPLSGDIRLAFITFGVYVVLVGLHASLGVWPFPA